MSIGQKMWPLEYTQGEKLTTDDTYHMTDSTITKAHMVHFMLRWAKQEDHDGPISLT